MRAATQQWVERMEKADMGKIVVVDYSVVHPTLAMLKSANVGVVGRYFGQGSPPKNLTKAEAELLSNNNIAIFNIFEYGAQQATGGAAQAKSDVHLFRAQRDEIGAPYKPCYFAVDFDIPDYAPSLPDTPANAKAKLGPIGEYFGYIRNQMGADAGGYGGYWLIKRLFDADLISWGFQTIAWSGGQWDSRAQLRQTGATDLGNEADVDVPERTDFGQWTLDPPKPKPTGTSKADALKAAELVVEYLKQ